MDEHNHHGDEQQEDLEDQEQYDFEHADGLDGQAEIEADGYAEEQEEADNDQKDACEQEEEEEAHVQFDVEEEEQPETAAEAPAAANGTAAAQPNGAEHVDANAQPVVAGDASKHAGQQEWLLMDVPEDHRPLPLIRVRNIPADASLDSVSQLLSANGIAVHDIAYDDQMLAGKRIALVRLPPLPLPWAAEHSAEEKKLLEVAPNGDVSKFASHVVKQLTAKNLQIDSSQLAVDSSQQDVSLFVANLTPEYDNTEALQAKMESFGKFVRCYVAQNPEGQSKNYGIVEFQLPASARKAKEWVEKVEQEMRSSASRNTEGQGRYQQIKLMKAEWTFTKTIPSCIGRVLYVANLQTYTGDNALRTVFEKFGKLKDCYIPKQKGSGHSKGFAFIEFDSTVDADRAFRSLNGQHPAQLNTKILVSFSNPAKQQNTSNQSTTNKQGTAHNHNQAQQSGSRNNAGKANKNAGRPAPLAGPRPLGGPSPGAMGGGMMGGMGGPVMGSGMMAPAMVGAMGANAMMAGNPMMGNPMAAMVMQQAAMQQAQMQLRTQQLAMQQQLQQQQLAMHAQLQQTQAQLQAAKQVAQQYQQQATVAQIKAKQEAEARKRIEEAAQRQKAVMGQKAAFTAFPGYGVGVAGGMDMASLNASAMNAAAFGMGGYGMGMFGVQGMGGTAGQKRNADDQQQIAYSAQGGYGYDMQDYNKRMRF